MRGVQIDRRTLIAAMAGASIAAAAAPTKSAAPPALDVEPVVLEAARLVRMNYVDPPLAERLADLLLAQLKQGVYATSSPNRLAELLTRDLQSISRDLHLVVRYESQSARERPEDWQEDDLHPRETGWGIQTAARLPGNIGLLRITHFPSPPMIFAFRLQGAMTLLEDTRAIILDLRNNHGGGDDTSAWFISYFLDKQVELGRTQSRTGEIEVEKTWSQVAGPRWGEKRAVYIATSQITFSAGEAVALHLRQLRGAKIIGARTRGGAHSGNFFDLPQHFRIFIPFARAIGPDWEGAGIAPDVDVPPEQAVAVAHRMALDALMRDEKDPARANVLSSVSKGKAENLSSFHFGKPGCTA